MTSCAVATVSCRLAQPHEGLLVKDLFTRCYQAPCEWLSWEHVSPHWILGELNGVPSGMVMVGAGRPFGWIELLMVLPELSSQEKGRLVSALEVCAYEVLKTWGAQGAICTVADNNPSFHRIVRRKGFVPQQHGTVYLKRLL